MTQKIRQEVVKDGSPSMNAKNIKIIVRDGKVMREHFGRALGVQPGYDHNIDRRLKGYYDERYGLAHDFMKVPEAAIGRPEPFEHVPCAS